MCPEPDSFQIGKKKVDERYDIIGETPLYLLQQSSGVYDAIREIMPIWYDNGGS